MIQILVKQNGKWVVKKEYYFNTISIDKIAHEMDVLRSYGYVVDVIYKPKK